MEGLDAFDEHEQALDAVCALHPHKRASILCPYCGSYACGDCTVDTLWGDVMCESCRRHGRAQYPIPWEEQKSVTTFLHTVYLVFADTGPLFEAFPGGAIRPALGFAFSVAAFTQMLRTIMSQLFDVPRHWSETSSNTVSDFAITLGAGVALQLLSVVAGAGVFHGVALVLRGRGQYVTALRASSYLLGIGVLTALAGVIEHLLEISALTLLLNLVALFFGAWGLTLVGEHRYGMTRGRAVCAALAPSLVYLGLVLAFALSRLHRFSFKL